MAEIKYHLIRGTKNLGTITHISDDFPWHQGSFNPTENFEDVKQLFDEELRIVESDDLDNDKWENIWSKIIEPGLRLVSLDQNKEMNDFLIHIDGEETRWRE